MNVIILAGGIGTRLKTVVDDVPKPMAMIGDAPFLQYLFRYIAIEGITECVLSVGYKSEAIIEYFGSEYNGISIKYAVDSKPLGTGGAIKSSLELLPVKPCIVMNGDTFFDVSLTSLMDFHIQQNADISIALKEMRDFDRYGSIKTENDRIVSFHEKKQTARGFINGGIYCINPGIFSHQKSEKGFSFEKFLHQKLNELMVMGKCFDGNFIDIGIPDDYALAQTNIPKWIK